MAHFEFRLPDVGEGVAEGEVVAWLVTPGQQVREDQEMVEIMTDKATVTIGAPRAGRIVELLADEGEIVAVGSVLVVIDPETTQSVGGDKAIGQFQAPASMPPRAREKARRSIERRQRSEPPPARARAEPPLPHSSQCSAASAVGDIREDLPGMQWLRAQREDTPPEMPPDEDRRARVRIPEPEDHAGDDTTERYFQARPLATPATRKLARDLGVDLRVVPPSGSGGRVTKHDVQSHAGQRHSPAGPDMAPSDAPGARPRDAGDDRREQRIPFVGLRRRIAQRMHDATTKPAAFTFVEELEVDRLGALVQRLRPAAEARGIRLHYLPFVVKAVTLALKKHPVLNSWLDEDTNEIVLRRYYHIGIATSTPHGLVVPVVRDADRKSPLEIAENIQQLAAKARAGGLGAEDLRGSTFTITSLGKRGGLLATPVLNHPEVGIVGVHRIREKPVVRDGSIAIGQVMMLSLSFDHRVVDGDVGAAFAYDVIAYLESPELLLLEMH